MTFDLGRVTTASLYFFQLSAVIAVTFDLGRVTTSCKSLAALLCIAVTFDLGRVTTLAERWLGQEQHCGDVRSRTSYNFRAIVRFHALAIAVTFDLGRVTTRVLR